MPTYTFTGPGDHIIKSRRDKQEIGSSGMPGWTTVVATNENEARRLAMRERWGAAIPPVFPNIGHGLSVVKVTTD